MMILCAFEHSCVFACVFVFALGCAFVPSSIKSMSLCGSDDVSTDGAGAQG